MSSRFSRRAVFPGLGLLIMSSVLLSACASGGAAMSRAKLGRCCSGTIRPSDRRRPCQRLCPKREDFFGSIR